MPPFPAPLKDSTVSQEKEKRGHEREAESSSSLYPATGAVVGACLRVLQFGSDGEGGRDRHRPPPPT
jgi:hypothetical protein